MKLNRLMPKALESFYKLELSNSKTAFKMKHYQQSWIHLERAHVLGQPYPFEHSKAHWKMLLFGIKTKNITEIIGQIPRLLFGGVKSFVGKIPVGNTGGANVPPLKPMDIPDDLMQIINNCK